LRSRDARLRRKHQKTVVRCYDFFDEFFLACGLEDLTEGIYFGDPGISFVEAQHNQAEYLLDQACCGERSQVLDIGCGYGRVLEHVRSRGGQGKGISLSAPQVRRCVGRGLDVSLLDYRKIGEDWFGQFDSIIANGSMEHFVHPADVLCGHGDAIYRNFFYLCHRLLRQGCSGRLVTTVIHFGEHAVDAGDAIRHPLVCKVGSPAYHISLIVRGFGGFFPTEGQLERCARPFFSVEDVQDGTQDYHFTSEQGLQVVRAAAFSLRRGTAMWLRFLRLLLRRPVYALTMYWCLMLAESWNWQFRGEIPPMRLLRHTWKANAGIGEA